MWSRFADFVIKRRTPVLGAILVLSLFFALQYGNLRYDNRLTQWIPEEDETLKLLKTTGEKFGANELILVMTRPAEGDVFSPSFLKTVKDLTRELREHRDVFLVTSLANVPYIEKSGDMLEIRDFLETVPDTPTRLEELRAYALGKENYVDNVVSGDGRWLALAVYLKARNDPIRAFREEVLPLVEERLGRRAEVHYSGIPSDAYFADRFVASDLGRLVPLIAFLVMLVLYFSFRRASGVVYPLLVVGVASFWVFGFMALFRWKMTLITPAVPVLLIALGSEYGIHLMDRIQAESSGPDRARGVREAVKQVAPPIAMAALTTIGGFLSFSTAKLRIIQDFGILSAWGILFALIVALTLIPAARASARKEEKQSASRPAAGFTPLVKVLSRAVMRRPRLILAVSLIVFLFFLAWIPRIEREVNFTEYYPPGSPPRAGAGIAQEHFGGAYPLTLYVQSDGEAQGVKSAGLLRLVRRASNLLLDIDGAGLPYSAADLIQELNFQLNGSYAVPDTDTGVANLWFFLEGRAELGQLVTEDASECLVVAKARSAATPLMRSIFSRLGDSLRAEFGGPWLEYRPAGLSAGQASEVRAAEAALAAEELSRLAVRYGDGADFDAAETRRRLIRIAGSLPSPGDRDVLEAAERVFGDFVRSEAFPFFMDPASRERLLRDLLGARATADDPRPGWVAALRKHAPAADYDAELAADAAETLALRLEEARTAAFAARAWSAIEDLLPERARRDENARRKIMGLLAEPADGLAVLPEGRVAAPSSGRVGLLRIEQSGTPSALARLDHFLLLSQVQSLALALVVTFLLMSAMRKSFRLGIVSLVPILVTVAAVYGTLGLAGVPLDYATMMIAGLSLGVGIDYTIHFVYGVKRALERTGSLEEAVAAAYEEKGRAILANSLAVTMGFLVLLLSSMSPLRHFGGMMVVSMLLAALASLTTLPALLLWVKPFKRTAGTAPAPGAALKKKS
ncbi:MAG: hypothetical protein FJY83_04585 [Candidatus Aminicenantes bacterium]|nr:hypothetical protein [Candidatus Aminicenantes bacterium]